MKKFFFLAAALVAAATMNAQHAAVTYHFDNNESTYSLSGSEDGNAFSKTVYSMDGVEGVAYDFVANGDQKGYLYLAADGDVFFEYKNSSDKKPVVKSGPTYLQMDSKNFVLNVKNLTTDDEVYILYGAKGSTAPVLGNADNENSVIVEGDNLTNTNPNKCDKDGLDADKNYGLAVFAVKAASNGGVKIKETAGGMRVYAVSINEIPELKGEESALENTSAVKAVKALENGQIVIIKNGVRYNVLGAKL